MPTKFNYLSKNKTHCTHNNFTNFNLKIIDNRCAL